MANSIYQYQNLRDFLSAVQCSARSGRRLTAESWSKALGYKSHRSVAMVISGARPPSQEMTGRLAEYLRLNVL